MYSAVLCFLRCTPILRSTFVGCPHFVIYLLLAIGTARPFPPTAIPLGESVRRRWSSDVPIAPSRKELHTIVYRTSANASHMTVILIDREAYAVSSSSCWDTVTSRSRETGARGTNFPNMALARQIGLFTLISTVIQSVLLAMIQDMFYVCYNASIQSHYQTFVLESTSQCSLVCLGHDQCAGFEICRPDVLNTDHICRLRNVSAVTNCTIQSQFENTLDGDVCVFYRRVSIHVHTCYIIMYG
jgi:hypothetical protein